MRLNNTTLFSVSTNTDKLQLFIYIQIHNSKLHIRYTFLFSIIVYRDHL